MMNDTDRADAAMTAHLATLPACDECQFQGGRCPTCSVPDDYPDNDTPEGSPMNTDTAPGLSYEQARIIALNHASADNSPWLAVVALLEQFDYRRGSDPDMIDRVAAAHGPGIIGLLIQLLAREIGEARLQEWLVSEAERSFEGIATDLCQGDAVWDAAADVATATDLIEIRHAVQARYHAPLPPF